jgi:multiple sugar transport system permease protein
VKDDEIMTWNRGIHRWKWVAIFLMPSLIGLSIFILYPIASSFWLAFQDWNLLSPPEFVGLANFQELLSDQSFWQALRYTLTFIVLYIPTVFVFGLALAIFLNQRFSGIVIVRISTFLPVVASWVVVSLIWKWIFNPAYGLVNFALAIVGIEGPDWLFQPQTAVYAMVITSVWKDIGYIALLYLGGLQNISESYYEAARIDGAGRWRCLRYITLPLLTPTMFFVAITLLINYFQLFEQVWLMPMRDSAADRQVEVIVTEVVKNAFSYNRMGYASAMSWVLFALIFVITFVQLRLQKRWVHYESE